MKKILILTDAISENPREDELDTLVQVKAIESSLKNLGYITEILFYESISTTAKKIKSTKPYIVFNLVEDERYISLVPLMLEKIGVMFTGAGSDFFTKTNDKIKTKHLFKNISSLLISVPGYISEQDESEEIDRLSKVIIKPVSMHGSFGIDSDSVMTMTTKSAILNILKNKREQYGVEFFAEEFICGREFNVGVIGGMTLPFAEMVFKNYQSDTPNIIDYKAKWDEYSHEYHSTVRCFDFEDPNCHIKSRINSASDLLIDKFNISSFVRFDYRYSTDGKVYLLEINANPCLSPDGGFFAACKELGLSYDKMVNIIINETINKTKF